MWQCPLCSLPLAAQNRTWCCGNQHSFDIAKAGYVNLLPVQHKNSRQPGDDKNMLQARRAFHDSHGYAPLMNAIAQEIAAVAKHKNRFTLLDTGCGEGSYLAFCQQYLQQHNTTVVCSGSDIAKPAVEMAAKRHKHAQFVVASSFALPIQNSSQNAVLNVFAPGDHREYWRVLADDGLLITVEPGPKHLWELKQQVYDNPREHDAYTQSITGFTLRHRKTLAFVLEFDTAEQTANLLLMTPFVWKLTASKIEQLKQTLPSVTADFVINVWQKETESVRKQDER